jgi:hypothetical protein
LLALFRNLIEEVMDQYARRCHKARWVDKTPNYYRLLPFIDRIFDGAAQYVLVVRHPLDCIDSLMDVPAFKAETISDPDIARSVAIYGRGPDGWAKHWTEVNAALWAFLSTSAGSRCHVVRYEDLVASPETVLKSLCAFLSEEFPPDLVHDAFQRPLAPGYGDWKVCRTATIHSKSLGRSGHWTETDRRVVWNIVGGIARQFGYLGLSGGSAVGDSNVDRS